MPRRNDREEHRPMREVDLDRARHVPATAPPCAAGCMRSGRHLDAGIGEYVSTEVCSLACTDACERRCRGDLLADGKTRRPHCRGCVPRLAEVLTDGTVLAVCKGCAERVRKALDVLPGLVAWIRAQDFKALPNGFGGDGTGIGGARTPPAPIRIDALDASDELHAMLASWCHVVVEEHPVGFKGPDLRGSVRSRAVLADMTGPVIGLAGIGGRLNPDGKVTAVPATTHAATWLTRHLDWALCQEWAAEMVREIASAVETAEHRWPRSDAPEETGAPCLRDGCIGHLVREVPIPGRPEVADGDEDKRWTCDACRERYGRRRFLLAAREGIERRVRVATEGVVA